MQFHESAPVPQLAPFVERVWILDGHAEPGDPPQPVLPDGRPELVLHFGDPFKLVSAAGHEVTQPSIIFAGQLRSQLLLRPTGRIALVGVRFHPHGAACLLREPQHRLAGPPLALGDLDPRLKNALAMIQRGADDLAGAALDAQRVLTQWMAGAPVDMRVACAVDLIIRTRGRVSIDRAAARSGITRRHLERQFLDRVGLAPKRLARIVRFQHALQLLEQGGAATPGAHTAAECGYADQAHFVRDFRELAGCAPSQHLLAPAELTGFFIDRTG